MAECQSVVPQEHSEEFFKQRLEELGLGAYWNQFQIKGLNTVGNFAFLNAFQPGEPNHEAFMQEVVTPILGRPDHVDAAKVRRIFFEVFTMSAGDFRSRLEGVQTGNRQLAPAEREARRSALESRLVGIELENGPAHKLIDLCTSMFEESTVKYVPWEKFASRIMELTGSSVEKKFVVCCSGYFKQQERKSAPEIQVSTGFKLRCVLQRCGNAALLWIFPRS